MAKKEWTLGGQVHALAVNSGFGSDKLLCDHFIRMYAAQEKLQEAADVFKGAALPYASTWCAIISAHTNLKEGQAGRAVDSSKLYRELQRAMRRKPSKSLFAAALRACAAAGDLQTGRQVQSHMDKHWSRANDPSFNNSLIKMYAKCASLRDARSVFDGFRNKTAATWNAMIAAYAEQDDMGQDALSLYSAMRKEATVVPSVVTFLCLLQACGNIGVSALEQGKQLHSEIKERGVQSDVAVGRSLVKMYAKCGSLRDARIVFDGLPAETDVVTSWDICHDSRAWSARGHGPACPQPVQCHVSTDRLDIE